MHSPTTKRSPRHITSSLVLLCLLTLLAGGCATRPWQDTASAFRHDKTVEAVNQLRQQQYARLNCLDADVRLFLTSRLKNRALSGYIQVMQPTWLKFVTSNPLGQPLYLFTSNGSLFNYADTSARLFMDGDLETFLNRNDIPLFVQQRSWAEWLTARLPEKKEIIDIREDRDGRGTWISYSSSGTQGQTVDSATEHILIDPEQLQMIGRIYTDPNGSIEAEIHYDNWHASVPNQPELVIISGLDYGARIEIELLRLQEFEECRETDFRLPTPPGFTHVDVEELSY